jgi:AcrR family transcriptional regulator
MYHVVHASLYHMVQNQGKRKRKQGIPVSKDKQDLLARCLHAFVRAGTLDLSLDQLAEQVGISKRMLIHYFGHREAIEERAMTQLEEALRARFRPDAFPPRTPVTKVLETLWEQSVSRESRGILLLIMELTRRAWRGSDRAQKFYREQQQLWVDLLLQFSPDRAFVEMALQLFQGAILTFVVTGDPSIGPRVLSRLNP